MLRVLLLALTLFLGAQPGLAALVDGGMACVDARQGMGQRLDRIVVVTGFSTLDATVVVT